MAGVAAVAAVIEVVAVVAVFAVTFLLGQLHKAPQLWSYYIMLKRMREVKLGISFLSNR